MAKRGRPRHPDILTPREWDVLALLREGATNEQIAQRLGITERTAKFHVSEILSKLGVSSREEAAAWRPEERRPWWLASGAPVSFVWRRTAAAAGHGVNAVGVAIGGAMFAAIVAGIVLLALFLSRGGGSGSTPATEERIAFSAGGSIYTVRPDGTGLREVVPGGRKCPPDEKIVCGPNRPNDESNWNAAPAFSPDGSRIAYTRDDNIWIANSDGSGAHELASVRDLQTPPDNAASNFSTGAQSIAWAPDGKHIAYVMGRIGGSGVQNVWVIRSDGSERKEIYQGGADWIQPVWLNTYRIAVYEPGQVRVVRITGEQEPDSTPVASQDYSLAAIPAPDDQWLIGPITRDGPIRFGKADSLQQVATGVGPALSPNGTAFAYFAGDTIHVTLTSGDGDEHILDLAPLGGRDYFFGDQSCPSSCSYRVSEISWTGGTESTQPRVTIDQPGIYIMRPDGSALRRVSGNAGAFAWAPQGDGFTYTTSCGDGRGLYVSADVASGGRRISSLPDPALSISWASNASAVALTMSTANNSQGSLSDNTTLLISVPGGSTLAHEDAAYFGGWSSDGTRYVIGTNAGSVIVDRDSGQRSQLALTYARSLWSPVDRRIAFGYQVSSSGPPYNWIASGVDVMNGDGTERTTILPLERHGTTGASEPLAWSPDGRWLLVKPMSTNHFLIEDTRGARAPVDLGQTFKLATGAWSPDGTLLALLRSGAPDVDVKVELMTPSGGRQKVMSLGATTSDPRFAPDSKQLTYVSGDASTGSHSLYVTDITPGGASSLLAKGQGNMSIGELGWSSDGQYLAFGAGLPTNRGPCGTPVTQAPP